MLDVRKLRYFLAVAEHLHFGQAADRLHVAQSALSTQIAGLETDLGVRLLNRAKRSAVTLTDAGRRFEIEARSALQQMNRAERIGRLLGRGELGHIDIAYVASAALSGYLAAALRSFRSVRPDVSVRLTTMDTPRQLSAIADGSVDIGFVRPRPAYPSGIATHIVHRDRLMIAMAHDHPLALCETVKPSRLLAETFVIPDFQEAAGLTEDLARLGEIAGGAIVPAMSVGDFVTALSLAEAGYGVVLIPSSYSRLNLGRIAYRDIEDFDEEVSLAVAWRTADATPAARALLDILSAGRQIRAADEE